ncbi:uncharacterized protein LOC144094552 [Amblyomma americanum]
MAAAITVLVLLGLNVALGALASSRPAVPVGRRDTSFARTAALRRLRRDVEAKTGNMDRVVCVLLGSSWCERGARDADAGALEDGGGGTEDELRETAAPPCKTPACKLFAKRKKLEKRRPPDQSPDSQFYSGW